MNKAFIRYTLGIVLNILALLFLVPIITAVVYGEKEGIVYTAVMLMCLILGMFLSIRKPEDSVFFLKDGCVITVLSWILLSFMGGLPYFLTGEMNGSFIDSMFEAVSGFTTTGATILSDVESLSKATMIWRTLSHWIGGMGVLVFFLALIPLSGGSNINLMRAESTGTSVGKLAPKLGETARIMYLIYIALTVILAILLLLGGVPVFDALNLAFATTSTGGFGIYNDSISSYSTYTQWVIIAFMVLSALKFDFYYFILMKRIKRAFSEEVAAYLLVFLLSTTVIVMDMIFNNVPDGSIKHAAIATSSIMSTTGFVTLDFDTWPALSKCILVILMFSGGCTGSTAGGLKMSRLVILLKSFSREIRSYVSPRYVKKIKIDGDILSEKIISSVHGYLSIYVIIFILSVLIVSMSEGDLVTNFTSVASAFNNVGPGLGKVGPTGNFGFHSIPTKIVLIVDMLAGRLEIFPLIVFFNLDTWKMGSKRSLSWKKKSLEE